MLVDIVERLSNWKHASFRRDGSTLETMMEAANEITSLREQLAKKDGEPVTEKYSLSDAIQLSEDLLNPNMFGYSVTAEVRNRAREVLGLKGRE